MRCPNITAKSIALAFYFCSMAAQSCAFEAQRFELLQDRDYAPAVIGLINGARQSVNVCMFNAVFYPDHTASPSNKILLALIAAHKRGVSVAVILDNGGTIVEVAASNARTARLLHAAGIAVFFDSDKITTHTKFLTIDASIAIVGSTNWTYHGLEKNHELSAILYSHEAAGKMNDYFEKVRSQGKRF